MTDQRMSICPSTITEKRIPCTRAAHHDGQHAGGGWVWWRGNGETRPPFAAAVNAATEETPS